MLDENNEQISRIPNREDHGKDLPALDISCTAWVLLNNISFTGDRDKEEKKRSSNKAYSPTFLSTTVLKKKCRELDIPRWPHMGMDRIRRKLLFIALLEKLLHSTEITLLDKLIIKFNCISTASEP